MESRYKVIISNKNIYKEIELFPQAKEIKVGTGLECDVRLRKELFFGNIELKFVASEETWTVLCSDNLYLTLGDVRKLMTKELKHGETLEIRYQDSDIEVFELFFTLDFEYDNKIYDTEIDISQKSELIIGGNANADIFISDRNIGSDWISLKHYNGVTTIFDECRTCAMRICPPAPLCPSRRSWKPVARRYLTFRLLH